MKNILVPSAICILGLSAVVLGGPFRQILAPLRVVNAIGSRVRRLILPDVTLPADKDLINGAQIFSNLVDLTGISTLEILRFQVKGGLLEYLIPVLRQYNLTVALKVCGQH
jgi:hypothetical protein